MEYKVLEQLDEKEIEAIEEYKEKNIKDVNVGDKVKIIGQTSILEKNTVKGAKYFLLVLTDKSDKISQVIFSSSKVYKFIEKLKKEYKKGQLISVYGTIEEYKTNKQIKIMNIEIIDELKGVCTELCEEEVLKKELNKRIGFIDNIFLKMIVETAINYVSYEKLLEVPFTEKTAYNYKGGLVTAIIDMCDMSMSVGDSINNSFSIDSTSVNMDLLIAGSIIANLGKCKTLELNSIGIANKTKYGIFEDDSVYSREIASYITSIVLKRYEEQCIADKIEYNKEYYENIVLELLHMVSSLKGNVNWGALSVPRSKHAMLLAHINNIVYTKGLYENLEKNEEEYSFTKAYDNGRNYFISKQN